MMATVCKSLLYSSSPSSSYWSCKSWVNHRQWGGRCRIFPGANNGWKKPSGKCNRKHRVEDNRLRTGWETGVGEGWLMQHDWMVLFGYGRWVGNIITPKPSPLLTVHRLSFSEPTQVTNFSVLPTMGGFYRGKVGGRYWGEHRKCTAFAPCHQNLKRVNFMLSQI